MPDPLPTNPPPTPIAPKPIAKEELDRAFKAFKKRLKIYQNDTGSMAPASHLSGNKPTICGITPPNDFPPEVWDALVARGKLKKSGRNTYELAHG